MLSVFRNSDELSASAFPSRRYIAETEAPAPLSLIGTDAAGPLFRRPMLRCDICNIFSIICPFTLDILENVFKITDNKYLEIYSIKEGWRWML